MKRRRILSLATVFALASATASAHSVGLSRGAYRLGPDGTLSAALIFARPEVAGDVAGLDADHDGTVDASELAAGRAALATALVDRTTVVAGGASCPGRLDGTGLVEGDGLSLDARWDCPPGAPATVSLGWLDDFAAGHRHLAQIAATSAGTVAIAYRENRSFTVPVGPPETTPPLTALAHALAATAAPLVLLALLRAGATRKDLSAVLGAFLAAQALALAACALVPLAPAARIALPAGALTLAYLGVENAIAPALDGRWKIAIPIGLVQGLALASAGAPVGWTLVVELALAAALVLGISRAPRLATGSFALSALAIAAGAYLFVHAL